MKATIAPGKYIFAVSGGVDSVVLLHFLKDTPGVTIVVAHYDHGIRPDSTADCEFVEKLAAKYGLNFEFEAGKLGAGASEATARTARYAFLKKIKESHQADAIVTAHHQDDVLETAIINLSRGTGRRGLTSLASGGGLTRPLLDIPKEKLMAYARDNNLEWREDSTNTDVRFLRNHIRHDLLPNFTADERDQLLGRIAELRVTNLSLDKILAETLDVHQVDGKLDRQLVAAMPEPVIRELLMFWWRSNGFYNYESKTLARATDNILNGKTGAIVPLKGDYSMTIGRSHLALYKHER